jgi:hypothetical protein
MSIYGVGTGGRGAGYRETYVQLFFNNMTTEITFDNWEVSQDIKFGERHFPEVSKSAMGKASKVSARIPLSFEVSFNLCYPKTIGKLNDILAITRDRYTLLVRVWGAREWPASSPAFVTPAFWEIPCILEFPESLSWRHIARGQGISKDTKPVFIFHESERLAEPATQDILSGQLVLAGDGSNLVLSAGIATGIPKTKVTVPVY